MVENETDFLFQLFYPEDGGSNSSKTFLSLYKSTRRHILEDGIHSRRHEIFNSQSFARQFHLHVVP
jgi:hypothetical protein